TEHSPDDGGGTARRAPLEQIAPRGSTLRRRNSGWDVLAVLVDAHTTPLACSASGVVMMFHPVAGLVEATPRPGALPCGVAWPVHEHLVTGNPRRTSSADHAIHKAGANGSPTG